jgi:hypothetical protein
MLIRTDEYASLRCWDVARNGASEPTYSVWIEGATHGHFTMNGMMLEQLLAIPAPRLGFGPIPAARAHAIFQDYLIAFMEEHVLGEEQSLLAAASPYEDVAFERVTPSNAATATEIFGAVADQLGSDRRTSEYEVQVEPASLDVTRRGDLFDIARVPEGSELTLRLRRDGMVPTVVHLTADPYFEHLGTLPLVTPAELERIAATAGVELDPSRGHVWLRGTSYYREKAVVSAGGVVFSTAESEGADYLSDEVTVDLNAEATVAGVGGGWIFNQPPGRLGVSATTVGQTCRETYRADGPANRADVVVEADSVSIASFSCE